MPGYYDIDNILAEEELIPCTTYFDYSHLSHLAPDQYLKTHVLPKDSKIQVPLWAVRKWADLGFCRLALPKHYRSHARELLQADPVACTLRPRFFLCGKAVVDLVETSAHVTAKSVATSSNNSRRSQQLQQLERVLQEAAKLRDTLLQTYKGERLCQTLDWALSSVGEDVTSYVTKLSWFERCLFKEGAIAAANHSHWKVYSAARRMQTVSKKASRTNSSDKGGTSIDHRTVSPDDTGRLHRDKRSRTN